MSAPEYPWAKLPTQKLLDWRICDLKLDIAHTPIPKRVQRVVGELERRGIQFNPPVWLAEEWFSPDGNPGVAVPFFLAHPRLMALEEEHMFDVEGGTERWCMQLLRHEMGHALDTAYRLHRRKRWREVFGSFAEPYPEVYRPTPYSKRYVLHLDWSYAQSHPADDYAETFSVWLRPGSSWRKEYEGWPALKKLLYIDETMREIAGTPAPVKPRRPVDPSSRDTRTLRAFYAEKLERYGSDGRPEVFDRDLRRLFSDAPPPGPGRSAAKFLAAFQNELRLVVAHGTGEHPYIIDHVLRAMIVRCRELRLFVTRPENQLKMETAVLLSVRTINYLHGTGRLWVRL